jgi:hypothetical protein
MILGTDRLISGSWLNALTGGGRPRSMAKHSFDLPPKGGSHKVSDVMLNADFDR